MRGQLSGEAWARLGTFDLPWEALTAEQAETFAAEMRGEVSEGHVLHGVHVQFLGRWVGDDFLAYAPELGEPWVSVHLTWLDAGQGKAECPPWPSSSLSQSPEAFCAEQEPPDEES